MLARHAFQLAAAHAKHRPPVDQWAFLEEIDAPQWVDLTLEAALEGSEGDDPWFHQTHWHHETPLIHLSDLLPQQAISPGACKSRPVENKIPVKRTTSPKSHAEGSGGNVWDLQRTGHGHGWPRSQAKRVQPLCLASQVDYDLEGPCSTGESAVVKTPEFLHDGGQDELQEKRRGTCTSEPLVNSMDMVGYSVGQSQDGVVPDFCLESVGSSSSLTQVRRKYLSTSENNEMLDYAREDEHLDHRQSVTSGIRELQTSPEPCSRFGPVSALGFPEGPSLGLDHKDVVDRPKAASELPAYSETEPECTEGGCSPATRKPIPDWSAQISRLRKSWGGALRVKQGDTLEPGTGYSEKESGALRNVGLDDDRCRKSWGGALRMKQNHMEPPVYKDGEIAAADMEAAVRIQKSSGGATRVWEETTEPSSGDGKGSGAMNLDVAVSDGGIRKRWKCALRLKQENVEESCKGRDVGNASGPLHLDRVGRNEKTQIDGNLDPEEQSSCVSEVTDPCLGNDGPAEMRTSHCSTLKLGECSSKSLEKSTSDDSMVCDTLSSCISTDGGELAPVSKAPPHHCKLASPSPIPGLCSENAPSTAVLAEPKRLVNSGISMQSGVRGKEGLKGRPPKGNKENLSLETGGKGRQSNHVTVKPHAAFDRQTQQQKAVLRMSMPIFQPGEALRRSVKSLGSDGSVRRSVSVGRTKPGPDSGVSKTGHVPASHTSSSKRPGASSNGQACIRKSMSAVPADTAKRSVSGVNKSMRATGHSGLRTSICEEKETDLAALIAEHNRKVRPVPQYEPRLHSLRDIREWERRAGQKYYSLPAAERAKVNQELSLLKGAS